MKEVLFICPWIVETEVFSVLYSFTKVVFIPHFSLTVLNNPLSSEFEDLTDDLKLHSQRNIKGFSIFPNMA